MPTSLAPPLFGASSTTGLELELLCPRGRSRATLAHALADALGAEVRVGLKHHAIDHAGRPASDLSLAWRVVRDGRRLCDVVDDVTLRAGLDPAAPTAAALFAIGLRLPGWLDARSPALFRAMELDVAETARGFADQVVEVVLRENKVPLPPRSPTDGTYRLEWASLIKRIFAVDVHRMWSMPWPDEGPCGDRGAGGHREDLGPPRASLGAHTDHAGPPATPTDL